MSEEIGEGTIRRLLREKFSAPAYALFEEVKNQTGYSKHSQRYADALALSLWPSRGITMSGFEIKVSRGDWKKELDDPAKAAEFMKYCSAWYVVAPEGIVERLELPATWGLIEVPTKGRKRLVIKVEAPALTPGPWDQAFVAALLRRQHESLTRYVQEAVGAQLQGERERQKKEHEAALLRSVRGEELYRGHYQRLLQRLGLNEYNAEGPEVELALERLTTQLAEVRAEQSTLFQMQLVTGALRNLATSSEQALRQFAQLEATAAEVRRQRDDAFARARAALLEKRRAESESGRA